MPDVLTYPDTRLRQVSRDVTDEDYNVKQLIELLTKTMYAKKGAGLAAVQMGVPLRVFVVEEEGQCYAFINPRLLEVAREREDGVEGCLSLPDVRTTLPRPRWLRIQAWDAEGEMFELRAAGRFARVIHHELDHLDGLLYIDKLGLAKRNLLLRKYRKMSRGR